MSQLSKNMYLTDTVNKQQFSLKVYKKRRMRSVRVAGVFAERPEAAGRATSASRAVVYMCIYVYICVYIYIYIYSIIYICIVYTIGGWRTTTPDLPTDIIPIKIA